MPFRQGVELWEGLVDMGVATGLATASDVTSPPPRQATISYYQLMHMQTAPLPVHFQMLCESSKLYDPGQQYASHVRQLQRGEEPDVRYDFEPHVSANAWYLHWVQPHTCSGVWVIWLGVGEIILHLSTTRSPIMRTRKGSFNPGDTTGPEAAGSPPEEGGASEGAPSKDHRGECAQVHRADAAFRWPGFPKWRQSFLIPLSFLRWAWSPGTQILAYLHLRPRSWPGRQLR